jgi:hypothetical protein
MASQRSTANSGDDRRRQGRWLISLIITAFYSLETGTTRGNRYFLSAEAKEQQRITAASHNSQKSAKTGGDF